MLKKFRAPLCAAHTAVAAAVLLTSTIGTPVHAQSTSAPTRRLPPPPTVDAAVNTNETLANVRYDNTWEIYGGAAYSHFKAGPSLFQGSNLGGFDIQATRWLKGRLGATANARGYYGTNTPDPNPFGIHGPFVFEHLVLGGVTYRSLHNKHAALDLHALAGVGLGVFDHALNGVPPQSIGLFSNGSALATALGGSLDLNRSPKIALRISADYILTRYGGYSQNEFGISVGILYRLGLGKGPRVR